jgi:hypothetical protein
LQECQNECRFLSTIERQKMRTGDQIRQSIREEAEEYGLKVSDEDILPGDLYVAKKNSPLQLLTCKENNGSFIVPKEKYAYCFNLNCCLKVVND